MDRKERDADKHQQFSPTQLRHSLRSGGDAGSAGVDHLGDLDLEVVVRTPAVALGIVQDDDLAEVTGDTVGQLHDRLSLGEAGGVGQELAVRERTRSVEGAEVVGGQDVDGGAFGVASGYGQLRRRASLGVVLVVDDNLLDVGLAAPGVVHAELVDVDERPVEAHDHHVAGLQAPDSGADVGGVPLEDGGPLGAVGLVNQPRTVQRMGALEEHQAVVGAVGGDGGVLGERVRHEASSFR